MITIINEGKATIERKNIVFEQETLPPAIEAIKRDARKNPEAYVKNYRIPAEGE